MCAQHLELIYSQSGILYDIIPHDPRPSTHPKKPNPRLHADGVVGSIYHASMGHMAIYSHTSDTSFSSQNAMVPTQTIKVNLVQSMQSKNPEKPIGKNKRIKKKNSNTEKGTAST